MKEDTFYINENGELCYAITDNITLIDIEITYVDDYEDIDDFNITSSKIKE